MSSPFDPEYPEGASYPEYVESLLDVYPEYTWLHRFFSEPGGTPADTDIRIFDSIDNSLRMHTFPHFPRGEHLHDTLSEVSKEVRTRIIYVSYKETWGVDRDIISTLGAFFKVNPAFFWGHFHYYGSAVEPLCPRDLHGVANRSVKPFIDPLPSQHISLDLSCVNTGFSALFLSQSTPSTIIILCRSRDRTSAPLSRFYNNRLFPEAPSATPSIDTTGLSAVDIRLKESYVNKFISTRYRAALLRLSPAEISSADTCPLEYIYPFASLLIAEVNARVQGRIHFLENEYLFGAANNANTANLQGIWTVLHDLEVELVPTMINLSAWIPRDSERGGVLLKDYGFVMDSIKQSQHDLRDYLNRHVSMKSLEESRIAVLESRRSIELADSVKRLTVLALVFVPLSLVSSVFGMNFKEFGTGDMKIWVFFVTAGVVLVVGIGVVMAVMAQNGRSDEKKIRWSTVERHRA